MLHNNLATIKTKVGKEKNQMQTENKPKLPQIINLHVTLKFLYTK